MEEICTYCGNPMYNHTHDIATGEYIGYTPCLDFFGPPMSEAEMEQMREIEREVHDYGFDRPSEE